MKHKILLFLMFCGTLIASATTPLPMTFSVNNMSFETIPNSSDVILTGITDAAGSVSIPQAVYYQNTWYAIVKIGSYAFIGNNGITAVELPNFIREIEPYAFAYCSQLTTINFPSSLESIGQYAFTNCSSLVITTFPSGIRTIERYAFEFCTSLTDITINGVAVITEGTFSGCSGLTNVTLPTNLISIQNSAFYDCSMLESIAFPASLQFLGNDAFAYCYALQSISIPGSVQEIGANAFGYCYIMSNVTLSEGLLSIGEGAFAGCEGLTNITLPSTLTSIGEDALQNTSLSSITNNSAIPQEIVSNVFYNVNIENCTLIVPEGSLTAYQAADVWEDFYFPEDTSSPTPTILTVAQQEPVCNHAQGTFNVTGLVPNETSKIDFNIEYGDDEGDFYSDSAIVVADGNGNGTFFQNVYTENDDYYLTVTSVSIGTDNSLSFIGIKALLSISPGTIQYRDLDGDGFGSDTNFITSCNIASGYVLVAGDCNDNNGAINPNATEILYNRIDNNCNGILDDGFQKLTKIKANQCGATLAALYTSVSATPVSGATGYTFHVRKLPVNPAFTPINDPTASHVVTTKNYFEMRNVSGILYGTEYEITVEVRMSGQSVFVGYVGEACTIATPPVLAPGVAGGSTQCNTTLPNFYSSVGTTPIGGAVGYKFFLRDTATPGIDGLPMNYVGESIERSVQWFTLSMFQNVGYGRTYELQVAVKTSANGTFSPYSPSCTITTPPAQSLNNCNAVIGSKYENISTANLNRVTQYEFEITNIGIADRGPVTTSSIITANNYFNFNQIPAANYYPGIEYGVRVRVYVNNIASTWTEPCVITSPGSAGRKVEQLIAGEGFNAMALPNPFANSFAINVSTPSKEPVSYKVYDMTGRLLEAKTSAVSEMESYQVGDSYPAGVYNVIVSQGTEIKTLRVIKR